MVFGGAVAAVAPGGFVFYIYCLRLLRFGVGWLGWFAQLVVLRCDLF